MKCQPDAITYCAEGCAACGFCSHCCGCNTAGGEPRGVRQMARGRDVAEQGGGPVDAAWKLAARSRERLAAWAEGAYWGTLYRAALNGAARTLGERLPPVTLRELAAVSLQDSYAATLRNVGTWRTGEAWAILLSELPRRGAHGDDVMLQIAVELMSLSAWGEP